MSCALRPILKLQVSKVKSDALNIDGPFDELLFEKLENITVMVFLLYIAPPKRAVLLLKSQLSIITEPFSL